MADGRKALRRGLTVGTAAALVVAVLTVGFALASRGPSPGLVDLRGNTVAADPGSTPSAQVVTAQHAEESIDRQRFSVPSVHLDVPLGALNEVDGVIQPPGFTSAYLVRNRGVAPTDARKGTVYVVAHSLRNGGVAPGNYLIDVHSGRSAVAVGSRIVVGDVDYQVTHTEAVTKTELAEKSDLWADQPNRLIVITCLQVPANTPSVANMVITAERM